MKTRDYKSFAPGEFYHLFNRGNGKMNVFEDSVDYRFFLSRLEEYIHPDRRAPSAHERYKRKSFPAGAFSLLAFCLMPNHYHLLFRQNGETSLSALMLNLITGYSKYFNKKYDRVGALFQDQFKAITVNSNEQLLWVSAYIHQNPTLSGLVKEPSLYPYSSYVQYLSRSNGGLCDTNIVLGQYTEGKKYEDFVKDSLNPIKQRKFAEGALLHPLV